jgi:hypothetical protein
MTTIVFTSVPNELKGFFTENTTYYVDKWASFGVAVVTSNDNEDFYLNVETYKDFVSIDAVNDDFDGVAKGFSDMFY